MIAVGGGEIKKTYFMGKTVMHLQIAELIILLSTVRKIQRGSVRNLNV